MFLIHRHRKPKRKQKRTDVIDSDGKYYSKLRNKNNKQGVHCSHNTRTHTTNIYEKEKEKKKGKTRPFYIRNTVL